MRKKDLRYTDYFIYSPPPPQATGLSTNSAADWCQWVTQL